MNRKTGSSSFPNIVFLILDTARAQNISCYDHSRNTTPNIDRVAEEGVLYENAISVSPWTLPSHASLFTGVPPAVHRTNSFESQLPDRLITLAEFLNEYGYDTVGMSSNPWISSQFGLTRGFDEFHHLSVPFGGDSYREFVNIVADGSRSILERIHTLFVTQNVPTLFKNVLNAAYRQIVEQPDDGAKRAVQHAQTVVNREDPYFLFINFLEPHLPYEPPDDYEMKFMSDSISENQVAGVNQNARDYNVRNVSMTDEDFDILERLYDAEIKYVDDQIGRLLNHIDTVSDREETMVFILSDHGENIGDHGLMSHNYSVHETLSHVPLIVRYPGVFENGCQAKSRVSSLDIPATIASLLAEGSDDPFHTQQTGTSLTEPRTDRTIVSEYLNPVPPIERIKAMCTNPDFDVEKYDRTLRAIYDKDFKFIRGSDGTRELYDVSADPDERKDLAEEKPQIAAHLDDELTNWVQKYEAPNDVNSGTGIGKHAEAQLRELGYL